MKATLRRGGFVSGVIAGTALIATACFVFVGVGNGGRDAASPFPGLALPELQAQLGDGEYQFYPNRRNMWVVNPKLGRIAHYRFLENYEGLDQKLTSVGQVDQRYFPPEDTAYVLSERNLTDLLWVCNRRTGDFQLWWRNVKDDRLVATPTPSESSKDILNDSALRSSRPPQRVRTSRP